MIIYVDMDKFWFSLFSREINAIKWPTDGKIKEKKKTIKSDKVKGTI